jgi:hypothetical protein
MIYIYGRSDDLIEIDGHISDEIDSYRESKDLVTLPGLTVLRIFYDDKGEWRVLPVKKGTDFVDWQPSLGADTKEYSDVVTLDDSVKNIIVGRLIK